MDKIILPHEKPIIELEDEIRELINKEEREGIDLSAEKSNKERKLRKLEEETYSHLNPWQIVQISRHPQRPHTMDYINNIMDDFLELHGDRLHSDDPAIIAGFGKFKGKTVVVIGQQKGEDTEDNLRRRFGMPNPEGYRKAQRLIHLAEKFSFPLITFIDTPGAYPGIESEERGQASAISQTLLLMAKVQIPTVAVIIGEGGSGGALALGLADRVLILQFATYSVISPEGCAAILWKDENYAESAAKALNLTSEDLKKLKIVDEIIPEPRRGAHWNHQETIENLILALERNLIELEKKSIDSLLKERYNKYRNIGRFKG